MSDNEKTTQPASTDSTEPAYRYNAALAQDIEGKWQKIWDDKGTFWAANVNGDLAQCGLSGSPTKVKTIQNISFQAKESKTLTGSDKDVEDLIVELLANHTIG